MKKTINLLKQVHGALEKAGYPKTTEEFFAYAEKHSEVLQQMEKNPDDQAACLRAHAGECGVCVKGVFIPCN